MLPDVNDGDEVCIEYDQSPGPNKRVKLRGVVESDPHQRTTPDSAIDLSVQSEKGRYRVRVEEGGRVKGLHHATRRHDHLKGANATVEVR